MRIMFFPLPDKTGIFEHVAASSAQPGNIML